MAASTKQPNNNSLKDDWEPKWEPYSSYDFTSRNDGIHIIEINKYDPNDKYYYLVKFNAAEKQIAVYKTYKKTILDEDHIFKKQKLIVKPYEHKVKIVDESYIVNGAEREIIKCPIKIICEYGENYTLKTTTLF